MCKEERKTWLIYQKGLEVYGKIDLKTLNQPMIRNSHILDVFSPEEVRQALDNDIFPYNIFENNHGLLHKSPPAYTQTGLAVNRNKLKQGLDKLAIGEYVKVVLFRIAPETQQPSGHTMLIKKTGEGDYSFFDPKQGEFLHAKLDEKPDATNNWQLDYYINQSTPIKPNRGFSIAFLRGKDYLAHLQQSFDESEGYRFNQ